MAANLDSTTRDSDQRCVSEVFLCLVRKTSIYFILTTKCNLVLFFFGFSLFALQLQQDENFFSYCIVMPVFSCELTQLALTDIIQT